MASLPQDLSVASYVPMLKEYVEDPIVIRDLIYKNYKLMGMIEKEMTTGGKYVVVPVRVSGSQGISNQFSVAYSNQTTPINVEFQAPLSDFYGLVTVDNKAWRLSDDKKKAFQDALENGTDSSISEMAKNAAWAFYRAGTGTLGYASDMTSNGAGVITLGTNTTNQVMYGPTDAFIFEVGQTLQAFTADGGNGTGLSAVAYVVGVNPQAYQITVSATPGGSPGLPSGWSTTNPYLVIQGNFNNNIAGLSTWNPALPSGALPGVLYTVNRNTSIQKLAGTFVDTTINAPGMEEALIQGVTTQVMFGGMPDVIMEHPNSYAALEKALTGRRIYEAIAGAHEEVGFKGLMISAGGVNPVVIADPFCPPFTGFSLQLDTWKIMSAGKFPGQLATPTGTPFIDLPTQDATQFRVGGHVVIRNNAPGRSANFRLSQ
jgi:hypothetical protein